MNSSVGYSAFTTKGNGVMRQLINEVTVYSGDKAVTARALWDTGATGTCISPGIVSQLSLTPGGKLSINTPSGDAQVNTYLVNIRLPNNVNMVDIKVCDAAIGDHGFEVLIGMDIINAGDFAVSNYNGKTAFSFRYPSKEITDYALKIRIQNKTGSHGKGNRKKR